MLPSDPFEYPEISRRCDTCGQDGPLRLIVRATSEGFTTGHSCSSCGAFEEWSLPHRTEAEALATRRHLDAFGLLPNEMNFSEFDPGPPRHQH